MDAKSKKNEDIEKNLRMDRKKAEREVKLLLLGTQYSPWRKQETLTET